MIVMVLCVVALAAPTVLAALAFRRAGAVLGETRRIHQQLANIIKGAQKRALARRNEQLRNSANQRESVPPPLPVGPKLELLDIEEDWEDGEVETELPGAPTDWGFQPSPRRR